MSDLLNSCYACDLSGAPIGFPTAIGDDTVMNTSRAVHGPKGLNKACSEDCDTFCGGNISVTGFQFYSGNQSFYIRMRNTKRNLQASTCGSYTPTCEDYTRRSEVCTTNCTGILKRKPRITSLSQYGGGISPHVGAVTQKQQLKDLKRSLRTFVRGAQMSASARIRANRPKQCVTGTCRGPGLNKNTASSFIAINRYNPRPFNQTQTVELSCCTNANVGTAVRGNNKPSIPKKVIVCQDSCPV
jgi:hypothetical protein